MAFASITINIVLSQMNIGASKDWAKLWSYLCGAAPPFEPWNLSSSFFCHRFSVISALDVLARRWH